MSCKGKFLERLIGSGYSTRDLRELETIESLAAIVRECGDGGGIVLEAAERGRIRRVDFESAESRQVAKRALRESSGSVAVSDSGDSACRGYLIWGDPRVTTTLGLELPRPSTNAELLLTLCAFKKMASMRRFAYFHVRGSKELEGMPPGRAGLTAGLFDVYWINLFGAPFIELIGSDRLQSVPAAEIERLSADKIWIRATEWPPDPASEEWSSKRSELQAAIGREFFIDRAAFERYRRVRRGDDLEGVVGLRSLLSLLRSARSAEALERSFWAKERPVL